ncbi:putative iron-regulated membrane protein [Sediminihabitans luteus]|uniref:Putative iron-regulated membrane protein n=1 Tax=Sediminihabitans luteus TaxID=1138585 RepID=A0A2M9D0Y7_9CELL|nr:PepSY domain-containing protein [Sediminihabitans luteus]PJJ77864.1 putative iron-regulated membrane protein [Sediminihabitans luteus]GII99778.1 peptidase [Sediminihabitans luteus]
MTTTISPTPSTPESPSTSEGPGGPTTDGRTTPPDAGSPVASSGTTRRRGVWQALHPLLLRLHFYAGILVGPFLVVAATTGLLYTLAPVIERQLHDDLLVVPVGTAVEPLGDQVAAARDAYPEGTVAKVIVPGEQDLSTRVVLAVDDVPEGATRTVFVDPYTGDVLGQSTTYGNWLPEREWIETLHSSLHLGTVGYVYSELAASWLGIVVLGGLAMWIARAVQKRRARLLVVPEVSARGRRRTLSWHGVVGLLAAAGLVVLAVTGITWSTWAGPRVDTIQRAVSTEAPVLDTSLDGSGPAGGGGHGDHGGGGGEGLSDEHLAHGGSWDGVNDAATVAGLDLPWTVTPPAAMGQAWTVAESATSWPAANDTIAVDASTGEVVDRVDFADKPLMSKLTTWGIYFHLGMLFGTVNLVFLALVASALVVLVVLGYRMWWQRRPTRATGWKPGPFVRRGGLAKAPRWLVAVIAGVTLVTAWYLPLFGISLAAFLVVDVVLGARARRRVARPNA